MMSKTSDTLLERLNDRADSDAWQRLVDLYTPLIRGWLRRQCVPTSDADDIAQEVLAVVVRRLPQFHHNRRPGAFRNWLRTITTNCLRRSWRAGRFGPVANGGTDFAAMLAQLEDPGSGLSRLWDQEHDRHVVHQLLEWAQPHFKPTTWLAFRRQVLEGVSADAVAAELGTSVNAVVIAKSRVLMKLCRQGRGLVD
jgi:RNA polymerase sigma-70 factor (ECF subfamily)